MSKVECACEMCKGACQSKPGWFKPGEAEKAAKLLGIPTEEFFRTKLAVDWWTPDDKHPNTVFVLAPVLVGRNPGTEYPGDPHGRCALLTEDGKCSIHAAKPHECARYVHTNTKAVINRRKDRIVDAWSTDEAQAQIRQLLGREPEAAEYDGDFGILQQMFS